MAAATRRGGAVHRGRGEPDRDRREPRRLRHPDGPVAAARTARSSSPAYALALALYLQGRSRPAPGSACPGCRGAQRGRARARRGARDLREPMRSARLLLCLLLVAGGLAARRAACPVRSARVRPSAVQRRSRLTHVVTGRGERPPECSRGRGSPHRSGPDPANATRAAAVARCALLERVGIEIAGGVLLIGGARCWCSSRAACAVAAAAALRAV